jgi:hypothetical protein
MLVGYILLMVSTTVEEFVKGLRSTSSNYYEQLKRSASICRFLGDAPSGEQSPQNTNPHGSDRASSVHA